MRGLWLAIATLVACRGNAREAMRDQIVALDDGGVVLVERVENSGVQLARLDRNGTVVWSQPLREPQASSLALHGDIVTLRGVDEFEPGLRAVSLEAFSIEDGRARWRTPLENYVRDGRDVDSLGRPGVTRGADGAFLNEPIVAGGGFVAESEELIAAPAKLDFIVTIDPQSGRVVTRTAAKYIEMSAVGVRLYVHGYHDPHGQFGHPNVTVVEPTATSMFPTAGIGCSTVDEYVRFFMTPDYQLAFTSSRSGHESGVTITPALPAGSHFAKCAIHGDEIVVLVTQDRSTAIGFMNREGRLRTTMPVAGEWWGIDRTQREFPRQAMFGGVLPRFAPIVLHDEDGDMRLVVIDLDRREVLHDISVGAGSSVFQVDGVWYIVMQRSFKQRIVTIDGKTGALLGAVDIGAANSTAIDPSSVNGGSMWIASSEWGPVEQSRMARLNARSLRVEYASGDMQIVDRSNDPGVVRLFTGRAP